MKLILTADDAPGAKEAGGKAAALGRLAAASLPVPPWFVVSAAAFEPGRSHPRADVVTAIAAAVAALPGEGLLAVRSSAVDEDGAEHSFAGQLESYLFVPAEQVVDRVADVWRSGFTDRVLAYRKERQLGPVPAAAAVLVQRMVDADVSGVAFAADPIGGSRSTVVVSAVFGLGTALVGGEAEADTYRLRHAGSAVDQRIARKSLRHVGDPTSPGGVRAEAVPDAEADRPTLTPQQARQVADLALSASRSEGRPQDIEWAIRGEQLYLLQSRPITSLGSVPDPEGARAIWDDSNIAESYNGVTTPLTFSFARRAYEGAYRQFCRMMKVPAAVVADHDAMFGQMLGLIRGRIYYNLLNWYRLLAMLPGFSVNQTFMEQMMGVRQGLPPEVAAELRARTWSQRQGDRLRFGWSVIGLVWNHVRLPGMIRAFYVRLNDALSPPSPPLTDMRLDQLTAEFRRLEGRLLSRWDAPLVNDFLAMIFFGLLGKATKGWCDDGGGNLQNDLIGDEGGIISTEPVTRIGEMAAMAAADPPLVEALGREDVATLERRLAATPPLAAAYRAYLDKFGDRCLEELKLESATLTDDPTPLLRTIGQAALRLAAGDGGPRPFRPRQEAEAKVALALRGHPVRRAVFAWLLRNARGRIRDRENLRFERTRLFGRVRRVFVEVGRRLYAEGVLREARDVFYLTLDDVLGFVEGTGCDGDLGAVAGRRAETFAGYRRGRPPADRFETRGAVSVGNTFVSSEPDEPAGATDGLLQGTGCCPGVVRGPVRLIREPRGAHLDHGEILVAERTDPGWIMLFPAAAGVLVERGSLLSHSAIVARELGIPAVVLIPNLMRSLSDGQVVEMNGATGTIRVLGPAAVGA